jgi:hypothetical protein
MAPKVRPEGSLFSRRPRRPAARAAPSAPRSRASKSAIAAASSCGSPLVLADDAVFQFTDAGWRAIPTPGNTGLGFGGGRPLTLDAGVFAFDKTGHAWRFDVPCP